MAHCSETRSPDIKCIPRQGQNPATDFRGMGILGLESLVYFAQTHPAAARRVCNESLVPNMRWFSFAITHINLAFDVVAWCESEPELVTSVFLHEGATIETFHAIVAVRTFCVRLRSWHLVAHDDY